MLNLIRSDLFKMRKSLPVKICFGIVCLCAVFLIIISNMISKGTLGTQVVSNASLLCDTIVMSIIGAVIAGVYICSDFENKTVNAAISCGNGRGRLVMSKAVVYYLITAVMLLPYSVATVTAYISKAKFGKPLIPSVFLNILAKKSSMEFSPSVFLKMIAVMLTVAIVYAGRVSICLLLAFLLKKSAFVVGAGFGLAFILDIITGFKDKLGIFGKILGFTPYVQDFRMLTLDTGAGTLFKAIVCSIIFIALIFIITFSIFRKSEIK